MVPDAPSHFQHTAGLTFKFGGKDTDGDGIYDKDDACPDVAGLKNSTVVLILMETEYKIVLMLVQTFGLAALNGCPDTDGDGGC
jgi:hypothetical protein